MKWNFDENVPREGTSCVKYDLRKEVFGDENIIPMWVADMDFKTPDFIIKAIRKRLDHEIMGYSFRPHEYFQSITDWMLKRHNWKIQNDWICFSPGVVPALNLCTLAFTRPGDSIIIQPPVYPPFFSAVESHGRNLIYNQLVLNNGRYSMDFESLEAAITGNTKMIIISNPHNPVGRCWTPGELSQLAGICLSHNILILSDEIHSDLVLPGFIHTPISTLSDRVAEITVTCAAPSKTFNLAGLSTSSVIISNPVMRKYFNNKVEHLHIGDGNIFGTIASISAYSEGLEWLNALLYYLNSNAGYVMDFCRQFIPEIISIRPEGTYMIWLDCRRLHMSGTELQDFFVKNAGVGLNEGSAFGPGGEGYMRMNLATTRQVVEKAMDQIKMAVSSLKLTKR
jgi:cysteine-S-conjugate beta-lyase